MPSQNRTDSTRSRRRPGFGTDAFNGEHERQWSAWMISSQDGDREAYRRLLTSLGPRLHRFIEGEGVSPGQRARVVEEILLAAHAGRRTYRGEHSMNDWIDAIARSVLRRIGTQ